VMVGGAIRLQGLAAAWMLLLVAAFQLLTAPVSAHMISRVAYRRRHVRRELLLVDELREAEGRDSVYRGDEPADAPPENPAEALVESRREELGPDDRQSS
jgi:multicomponent Na+:H+ antiporter subunit G